ncbi:hypothetical protein H6A05_10430 [Megasphaera elsdenii]|uniref:hypothetical protein n=1 Tax=Megasphaera elsdenii TaxID=907 RepID=UPI00195D780B|nr:hypothetical protein [Megasphaera elsdenii]MBM6702695.1 hypothetical protein [Megasphaera elsdenii]
MAIVGKDRLDFLELLRHDEEVRDIIRQIISGGSCPSPSWAEGKRPEAIQKKQELRRALEAAQQKIDVLTEREQQALADGERYRQALEQAQQQCQNLAQQGLTLRQSLEQMQREAAQAQRERDQARRQCRDLEEQGTALRRRLEQVQRDSAQARQERDQAQGEARSLRQEAKDADKALSQRFAEGWRLYQQYQQVGNYLRDLLTGVFARPGFETFIIGAAQERSLRPLWSATREALMKCRDESSANILWDIFQYSLGLVNQSRPDDVFAIENVAVGDRYDIERHALTGGSRVQGTVRVVHLPGYRNVRTGDVVCKSLVEI